MESALRGMAQANIDLGVFKESKCTDGIYTHKSAGYRVVATDAPSRHRGRVALFYRPLPLFTVEAVRDYGPNVLSFEVIGGEVTSNDVPSPTSRRDLKAKHVWSIFPDCIHRE